jgi:diadenosine tetraphosphate (Ap4A) HIT family hydrolase
MFTLHPQLQQDCIELGRFDLCRLLLLNDARYPWCLLVPEREDMREIYELAPEDQILLQQESVRLGRYMAAEFSAHKLNVAALGNLVPQLHIHHIVRYRHDPAWPRPVWGLGEAVPYDEAGLRTMQARLRPLTAGSASSKP